MSTYIERKGEVCTYGRCGKPLAPDSLLCERHLRKERRRKNRQQKALRAARAAKGRCVTCNEKSETYRCPKCVINEGRVKPTTGEARGEAMEQGDQWRRDANGWERFRGKGHRGAPPASVNDDQDLMSALGQLEKGRHALLYAHSPEVKAVGRHKQRDARAAAAAMLALAARLVAEVVERNSGEQ